MTGIDLNKPIRYLHASMRYFDENEHHVTRFCPDDVLVLVWEGVLRFTENGTDHEIQPGQYYIQKHNGYHEGKYPSDSPKYLYVHFKAEWADTGSILPRFGKFDYSNLFPLMEEMDMLSHSKQTYVKCASKFFEILSCMYSRKEHITIANRIADHIAQNYRQDLTLDSLSEIFHFSKNHIINIFKSEYGMTPFEYTNGLRISRAERLLEATSKTAEEIAHECGFNDYSHFYKVFRRANGKSPIDWREQRRIQPYSDPSNT